MGQHVFTLTTIKYTVDEDKLSSHTESMVTVEVNNGQFLNCLSSVCPIKNALCIMYMVQPAFSLLWLKRSWFYSNPSQLLHWHWGNHKMADLGCDCRYPTTSVAQYWLGNIQILTSKIWLAININIFADQVITNGRYKNSLVIAPWHGSSGANWQITQYCINNKQLLRSDFLK